MESNNEAERRKVETLVAALKRREEILQQTIKETRPSR